MRLECFVYIHMINCELVPCLQSYAKLVWKFLQMLFVKRACGDRRAEADPASYLMQEWIRQQIDEQVILSQAGKWVVALSCDKRHIFMWKQVTGLDIHFIQLFLHYFFPPRRVQRDFCCIINSAMPCFRADLGEGKLFSFFQVPTSAGGNR